MRKLTREEFQRSKEESALESFLHGIRAKETKEKYTRTLRKILCELLDNFLEGDFEQRANQFVKIGKKDPSVIRDFLLNISSMLKERTELPEKHPDYLKPTSVDNYFKPLKKLLDMNDVTVSWKRIYVTFPEIKNIAGGRGWTRKEIQKMLSHAKGAIDRALILVFASSGIRLGGFDLNWGDITPIYKINNKLVSEVTESEVDEAQLVCASLRIYKGTEDEYPAFITPEAYFALQDYQQEWIQLANREPKSTDHVFIREGDYLKKASSTSIKKRIERMIQKAGLKQPLTEGQRRHDVPTMNGFRRFWNKTFKEAYSRDSPVGSLIKKEFMMGHMGLFRLDKNYFKTHLFELAEEYLNAVPDLTINDESRIKAENIRLRKEKSSDEEKTKQIEQLSAKLDAEMAARVIDRKVLGRSLSMFEMLSKMFPDQVKYYRDPNFKLDLDEDHDNHTRDANDPS